MDEPQSKEERFKLAAKTVLDFMPGGKILKLLKGPAVKLGIKKLESQLLKIAAKKAMKAGRTINFGKIKVPAETFHRQIKPDILSKAGNFTKAVGKNPDIKIVGKKISLKGTGPFKGKSLDTGLDVTDFFKDFIK